MSTGHPTLTPRLLRFLAVASGLTVANIYYNQSLLALMAREFHATPATAGNIAVATQLGYASGLLLGVPLGDMLDRKKLMVASAALAAAAMIAVGLSPSLGCIIAASYVLGLVCITPQIIIPYAAHLAEPTRRGRTVGVVMSGVLAGILFSRSTAGFLGHWLGWRPVFFIGAALTVGTALCLLRLPESPRHGSHLSYGKLLRSLPGLLFREPVLLRHALLGFCSFGAFNVFWSTLVFYLAARPEHYGGDMVGLLALIALAGAAVSPLSGRIADRFSARTVNGLALGTMTVSFFFMLGADWSLHWLALGIFLMDAGAQFNQISNQTRIYTLAPELRSRITSVYMVVYFIGGGLGSALGTHIWSASRWLGVCAAGALLPAVGLAILFLWPQPHPNAAKPVAGHAPATMD